MRAKKTPGRRPAYGGPLECDLCDHFKCSQSKDCFRMRRETVARYESSSESLSLARAAAEVEARHYCRATRVEEIAHLARTMGVKHLGVAFCTGFKEEARLFCDLMRRWFKVSSVCCKNCSVPKSALSMPHVRQVKRESMCNPLGQADLLNTAKTGLNVAMGLCVGHDALFFKHSKAPVTVLAAKDRILAHNPMGALYSPYVLQNLKDEVFS